SLEYPGDFDLVAAAVCVAGVEMTAVGREAECLDLGVQLHCTTERAGDRVPQPDRAVVAAGGEPSAVGAVTDARYRVEVAGPLGEQPRGNNVPDADRLDQRRRSQALTVGVK